MFKIESRKIGPGQPVFIIAEPGINHMGSVDVAKELITEAARCGADAIKFQTIYPEEVYSQKTNPKIFKMLKDSQFTKNQWLELKNFAKTKKIQFFSTPAGVKSLKLLKSMKISCIKIGSGELNKIHLIKKASQMKKTNNNIYRYVNSYRNCFNCTFTSKRKMFFCIITL